MVCLGRPSGPAVKSLLGAGGGVIAPPAPPWRAAPCNGVSELSAGRHPRLQPPSTAPTDNIINKAGDIAEDRLGCQLLRIDGMIFGFDESYDKMIRREELCRRTNSCLLGGCLPSQSALPCPLPCSHLFALPPAPASALFPLPPIHAFVACVSVL